MVGVTRRPAHIWCHLTRIISSASVATYIDGTNKHKSTLLTSAAVMNN